MSYSVVTLKVLNVPYSTKCWRGKTMVNRSLEFLQGNVGEFTIATIRYYSESGIRLGKVLANDDRFAKFPCQSFALYGIICNLLSKNQHNLHLQLWSFNEL